MIPRLTSGRPSLANVLAVRSEHASASSSPPPSAKPLIHAIEGLAQLSRRANTCWPKSERLRLQRLHLGELVDVAPATKASRPRR
jgi:hypothetical protein